MELIRVKSDIFRRKRKEAGLSLTKTGELIGISHPQLSRLEMGIVPPARDSVLKLAALWDLSPGELYREYGYDSRDSEYIEAIRKSNVSEEVKSNLWKFENVSFEHREPIDSLTSRLDSWVRKEGLSAQQNEHILREMEKHYNYLINEIQKQ